MSERLERGVEIAKLARLLEVPPATLSYLDDVPSSGLAAFREQVTDRLFGGDAAQLNRVAAASKLLPIPLTVKIAQLAFGPLLCAATSGLLEPDRAARIAARVPIPFLAEIATMMDPRRAADVIAAMPAAIVAAVGTELIAREEYVTMGRFVSFLPEATLRAAVREIHDDAALLRVAFVVEGKDHLDDLLDIARDRIPGLLHTAHEQDLWGEALDLVGHLEPANRAELGDLAARQDDDLLDSLIRAAQRMAAWADLLPVVAAMSGASLDRLAAVPAVLETDVLRDVVQAAIDAELWVDLLPLSKHLPDEARRRVAGYAAVQDDATLERIAAVAHDAGLWDAMLPIAVALPDEARARLASRPLLQRADVLDAIVRTAVDHDVWRDLEPLAAQLPDAPRAAARATAEALGRPDVVALFTPTRGRTDPQ